MPASVPGEAEESTTPRRTPDREITVPAAFAAALALVAVAAHPAALPPHTVIAHGAFHIAVPARTSGVYVNFPYRRALTSDLERCVDAHRLFSWRVLRPRPGPAVRFYIAYLGNTTLATGSAGESAVSHCWPLYVENRSNQRVVIEIRYRLVRWQHYGSRI